MGISEEQSKNCIRIIKELIFLPTPQSHSWPFPFDLFKLPECFSHSEWEGGEPWISQVSLG